MNENIVLMPLLNEKRLGVMFLLYARGSTGQVNEPIEGITRLQKMMFLLTKEHQLTRRLRKIDFTAYAYGPYAPELYDEIGFLRNMGMLADGSKEDLSDTGFVPARDREELSEGEVTFDYLMGDVAQDAPERYQTEQFRLSSKGMAAVEERLRAASTDEDLTSLMEAIQQVKARFNLRPLRDLIRYVYDKYPEYAAKSVIADKI